MLSAAAGTSRQRKTLVEERMAAAGFTGHASRRVDLAESNRVRGLRTVVEHLGGVFPSFAVYLASRPDLLSPDECLRLAEVNQGAAPTSFAEVGAILDSEFGRDCFVELDPHPFDVTGVTQCHRAQIRDTAPVVVKIVHPLVSHWLEDLPLLSLLSPAFPSARAFDLVVDDFRAAFIRRLDLLNEATGLDSLAREAEEFGTFDVPRAHPTLRASNALVLTPVLLTDILPSDWQRGETARLFCTAWLRHALTGRLFPLDFRVGDVALRPGPGIALSITSFGTLPEEAQMDLWEYLTATSNQESDRACEALTRQLEPPPKASSGKEIYQRFRQIVPFRDGCWDTTDGREYLAEHVLTQFRVAAEVGFTPKPHLVSFYRGICQAAAYARVLAPERDHFAEAFREFRLISAASDFREMGHPSQLCGQADQYLSMAMNFPQKMDRALTFAGDHRSRFKVRAASHRSRLREVSSVAVSITLLLATVAVLTERYGESNPQVERAGVILFLILGALLLKVVSHL